MNYQEQLNPWVIHQLLPDLNRVIVARFRRRTEAEAYLKAIQQLRPRVQFAIAFDVASVPVDPTPQSEQTAKKAKSRNKAVVK